MLDYITTKTAVKKYFGISYLEYALAASIEWRGTNSYKFRRGNGFGEYSYQDMADDHDITRRGAIKAVTRLKQKDLIEINPRQKSQKRVSKKWHDAHVFHEKDMLNIAEKTTPKTSEQSSLSSEQSSPKVVNKVHQEEGTKFTSASEHRSPHTLYRDSIDIVRINTEHVQEKNESIIFDSEQNQEEKNTPPIRATPPKKDLLSEARISFEDARKEFQKSKGIDPDVMTWSPSTIRDLEKVIKRLKEKMKLNGRLWETDLEFNEKYLKPFFLAAAQTEFWFNKIFSISILANRFSDSYDEILIQKNGNASSKTTAKIITPEAAFEATRSLIEEYQRTGSV